MRQLKYQINLSLYSLYYAEACNEFAGPIPASLRPRATQLPPKKCRNGGEPLATLCPIQPTLDLKFRSPAPGTERVTARPTGRYDSNIIFKTTVRSASITKEKAF